MIILHYTGPMEATIQPGQAKGSYVVNNIQRITAIIIPVVTIEMKVLSAAGINTV